MFQQYQKRLLTRDMTCFGIWGALLGAFGGTFGKRKAIGIVAGIFAGALAGAAAGYLGVRHYINAEFSAANPNYWVLRWIWILGPLVFGAIAGFTVASGNFRNASECVVSALVAFVIAIPLVTLLPGMVSPLEKPENIYPAWGINQWIALLGTNIPLALMLCRQAAKSSKEAERRSRNAETDQFSEKQVENSAS